MTSTQGCKAIGKLELVQVFYHKVHEATPMFLMVDFVREMTVKKSSRYAGYGSFE